MSLQTSYYANQILSIARGTKNGVRSNAKPLYLLAIIKGVEDGALMGNKLEFNEALNRLYLGMCSLYEPKVSVTPFFKPFFHMKSESFYVIKWKPGTGPVHATHTPSAKFLRENVEYAALDDDLWTLLQDVQIRNEFKEAIIKHYIKQNN